MAPRLSRQYGAEHCYYNLPPSCGYSASWTVDIVGISSVGVSILINDTVIDECTRIEHFAGSQPWIPYIACSTTFPGCLCQSNVAPGTTTYALTSVEWIGSLPISSSLNWTEEEHPAGAFSAAWGSDANVDNATALLDDGLVQVGLWRSYNIAAFFMVDTEKNYGTIVTPLGAKTTSETGSLYFAWQRKTGEFSFSANPICYV